MKTKALRAAALVASVAVAFVAAPAPGQQAPPQPAPPPSGAWRTRAEHVPVTYQIRAQLVETDPPDGLRVTGHETIVWENTSREPVRVLYFHTYANAFRNNRSTLLREWAKDELKLPDDMTWGDMPMPRISVPDGDVDARWVSPDDGNADDRTVLRAELSHAVEPGTKLAITVDFTLDLPRVIRRMGRRAGFAMLAQWYPKLGRYLGRDAPYGNTKACDGWYCHQYHSHSEFAADFANYDVTLEVPKGYTVGATGEPFDEREDEKKHTVLQRWRADSVVDFAWTASKRFVVVARDVVPVDPSDLTDAVSAEWRRCKGPPLPAVHVVLLLQPEHEDQADRCFRAARAALACYGTWLGPYPYPRLTIVDPPWNGAAAGGMEYPTLVTAGSTAGSPIESLRPEGVIVHEIGHQWFMNLLATNEAEEAWLDEGINTYFTAQALHIEYGPSQRVTDVLGFHFLSVPFYEFPGVSAGWPDAIGLPEWAQPAKLDVFRLWRDLPPLSWVPAWSYRGDAMMLPSRRSYLRRAGVDDMVRTSWTYADRASYGVNAYARPSLFLHSLRQDLRARLGAEEGDRRFLAAMREYARTYRFRHPTTADFLRTFQEEAGDPTPFADALVRTAASLDYAIDSVKSDEDPQLAGLDEKGRLVNPKEKPDPKKEGAKPAHRTIVRVRRRGEVVVPMVLEVERADGTKERARWETSSQGRERWRDFAFDGELERVRIDPDGVYLQDLDLSDNARARGADGRPAAKWSVRFVGWLENALVSYGRFF